MSNNSRPWTTMFGIIIDSQGVFGQPGVNNRERREYLNSRYVRGVKIVLHNISKWHTGKALLPLLPRGGVITIIPEPLRPKECNVQRLESAAMGRPGTTAGNYVLTNDIYFTPGYYCHGGVWDIRAVLFHELFHQRKRRRHLPPPQNYLSGEEFITTTATNVFRSELGVELRKGYGSFVDPTYNRLCPLPSPPSLSAGQLRMRGGRRSFLSSPTSSCPSRPTANRLRAFSYQFAQTYESSLTTFRRQESTMFDSLRRLSSIPFNPFRDLLRIGF